MLSPLTLVQYTDTLRCLDDSISTIYGEIDQKIGSDLALSSRFVVGCWGEVGGIKEKGEGGSCKYIHRYLVGGRPLFKCQADETRPQIRVQGIMCVRSGFDTATQRILLWTRRLV
jgi:hypothetical protein